MHRRSIVARATIVRLPGAFAAAPELQGNQTASAGQKNGAPSWCCRLDRSEVERYRDDRHNKGFNVIQVMVLHSGGAASPYGVTAVIDRDPDRPNVTPGSDFTKADEYDPWDHGDWVVNRAAERGIYRASLA